MTVVSCGGGDVVMKVGMAAAVGGVVAAAAAAVDGGDVDGGGGGWIGVVIHGIVNKMAGSNGSNQSISLAPKNQSHVEVEKAQRNEEFALHSLTKLAQAVTS
ncbi:hypothetical protein Tco_0896789 [Tanacetum coccineum]